MVEVIKHIDVKFHFLRSLGIDEDTRHDDKAIVLDSCSSPFSLNWLEPFHLLSQRYLCINFMLVFSFWVRELFVYINVVQPFRNGESTKFEIEMV
jgi:hypothetical protein